MLVKGDLDVFKSLESGYLSKIPTLGPEFFPDEVGIGKLHCSGLDVGEKLQRLLNEAGLSKGQCAGITNILGIFSSLDGNDLTVGDIRALTIDELLRLQSLFTWRKPTITSIRKIKKLLG